MFRKTIASQDLINTIRMTVNQLQFYKKYYTFVFENNDERVIIISTDI